MIRISITLLALFLLQKPTAAGEYKLIDKANQMIKNGAYTRIDSMLVYHNEHLVAEHYYRGFDENFQHRTHSTFKGITALLALKAFEKNFLRPYELVLPLLSGYAVPDNADEKKHRIRVHHLLNMTSGLDCDEGPQVGGPSHEWGVDEGPRPLQYALNISMAREPGQEFHYCSANSFLLAASISAGLKRSGKGDIFTFAQAHLFTPLQITKADYRLRYSPDGKFLMGQGNSNFKPRDLAKFGMLILNKGEWQSQRLFKESSIDLLLNATKTINWSWFGSNIGNATVKTDYSYQWYQTDFVLGEKKIKAIHSWGNGGQFIFIVPELNSVVVFTGSNQGSARFEKQKQPFEIMHRYILPDLLKKADLKLLSK